MSHEDRTKWDAKYARPDDAPAKPSLLLIELAELLPTRGIALDIAGGAGRNAIWLAQRGLDVTIADISKVGLEIAAERAAAAGVTLQTKLVDVECDPLPSGPWDVILSAHFLHRPLFPVFPKLLKPDGLLVVIHPPQTNLERHEKPPVRFLLQVLTAVQNGGAGVVSRRSNLGARFGAALRVNKIRASALILPNFAGRPRSAIGDGVLEGSSSARADQ